MPTIAQLNRRHAAAQRQRRQWLLRISVASLGVLCLIGMVVRQPSSSSTIKNRDNAVSPAHLLRQQQPWDRRQLKKTATTEKETSTTKKKTTTEEKEEETENTTISKTKKDTKTTEEEEETQDGSVMEEFVDEEEELVDGGDAEPEEPAEEDPKSTKGDEKTGKTKKTPTTDPPPSEDSDTSSTAGGGQTDEGEEEDPVELTHSEDNSASEDTETVADDDDDGFDGSEFEEPESGDDESEVVTSTEEPPAKEKKSKKTKEKEGGPKTPEEIFEAQAEEEEEAFWDAGDSGPVDVEEETEEPSRKFVFVIRNLDPDENGKTNGRITIVTHPEWAPIGAKHFHQLVDDGFYKGCRFFRVLPDFIAQFGISGHPEIQEEAKKVVLEDDPVEHTNARGTLTYATAGPNTRTTQLFFNTKKEGNAFLDDQGFAPFAEVVDGIEVLDRINSEYGERPNQSKITNRGQEYLDRYPNLSYIRSILEEKVEGAEDTE